MPATSLIPEVLIVITLLALTVLISGTKSANQVLLSVVSKLINSPLETSTLSILNVCGLIASLKSNLTLATSPAVRFSSSMMMPEVVIVAAVVSPRRFNTVVAGLVLPATSVAVALKA